MEQPHSTEVTDEPLFTRASCQRLVGTPALFTFPSCASPKDARIACSKCCAGLISPVKMVGWSLRFQNRWWVRRGTCTDSPLCSSISCM